MFEEADTRDFILDQREFPPEKIRSTESYLRCDHFDQIQNSDQSRDFFRSDRFDGRRRSAERRRALLIEQCIRPIGISIEKKRLKDSIPTGRTTGVCVIEKRILSQLTGEEKLTFGKSKQFEAGMSTRLCRGDSSEHVNVMAVEIRGESSTR